MKDKWYNTESEFNESQLRNFMKWKGGLRMQGLLTKEESDTLDDRLDMHFNRLGLTLEGVKANNLIKAIEEIHSE